MDYAFLLIGALMVVFSVILIDSSIRSLRGQHDSRTTRKSSESALNENTKVTSELVKEVAVLISKSDEYRKSSEKEILTANKKIEKLESSVIEMGKIQSQHIPVVNGVRNIVWKIFGSTLIGMGCIAGLVAGIIKMSSGE